MRPACFRSGNDAGHLLGPRAIGDEQRVGRVDDDQVLDAEGRDERTLGMDVGVGRVLEQRIALDGVAVRVAGARSHSDDQEPTSLQPMSTGSTTAESVRSITA